jgi:HD-like signal output (HDOD) protein
MIQRVQQVSVVPGITLHHLQRIITQDHQFGGRTQPRRLRRQIRSHRITYIREVLEFRVQEIEHDDRQGSLACRVIVCSTCIRHMGLRLPEGQNPLWVLLLGYGKVVLVRPFTTMCPFLSNTVTSRNTKRELTRIVGTFEAPGCN